MTIKMYTPREYENLSKDIHTKIEDYRDSKTATLVGIKVLENGEREMELLASNGDVYQLMNRISESPKTKKALKNFQLIALLTAGWAAPIKEEDEDNIAPSQHPDRIRVKMTLLGNTVQQYSSTLTFSGKDEIMYDYMNANGSLAEGFEELLTIWRDGDE